MTRGSIMEIPSTRGRVGTPIPEFGLAVRTFRSESASESASSEVLDGAGIIGDAIGVAVSQLLAAAGITRGATRFITGTPSTGVEACAAEDSTKVGSREVGLSTVVGVYAAELTIVVGSRAAEFSTAPAQRPELSTVTDRRREDTLHPAVRVASARAPSATTAMADRQEAFRHAEWAASGAEDFVVAVVEEHVAAGGGNRTLVMFRCSWAAGHPRKVKTPGFVPPVKGGCGVVPPKGGSPLWGDERP